MFWTSNFFWCPTMFLDVQIFFGYAIENRLEASEVPDEVRRVLQASSRKMLLECDDFDGEQPGNTDSGAQQQKVSRDRLVSQVCARVDKHSHKLHHDAAWLVMFKTPEKSDFSKFQNLTKIYSKITFCQFPKLPAHYPKITEKLFENRKKHRIAFSYVEYIFSVIVGVFVC